ncbi:MAG: M23 family metallopeptidase [Actinomycetota bacterium]|nr:M23 family metallopeptidase [Actinomycetota bacterium]
MRKLARATLGIVIAMVAASLFVWPSAHASSRGDIGQVVPTPTIPDVFHSPKPSSPAPKPSESTPPPDNGGGGDGGGNDHKGGSGGDGGDHNNKGGKTGGKGGRGNNKAGKAGNKAGKKNKGGLGHPKGYLRVPGSWTTDKLVAVAQQLRALGVSEDQIIQRVYVPFILAGPADWIDSWHFPRYGPAPGEVRQHEGQDVFCRYGEPVLATDPGRIEYASGGLGGNVARLYRSDGSYWYFAHLSGWNTTQHPSESHVEPGDVIGYCGNSGDAVGGPTHVHFGWYLADHSTAKNPLSHLLMWLHDAIRHATGVVGTVQAKHVKQIGTLTVARRFGDTLVPFTDELGAPSPTTTQTVSTTGPFSLAQLAMEAALAETTFQSDLTEQVSAATLRQHSGQEGGDTGSNGSSVIKEVPAEP